MQYAKLIRRAAKTDQPIVVSIPPGISPTKVQRCFEATAHRMQIKITQEMVNGENTVKFQGYAWERYNER